MPVPHSSPYPRFQSPLIKLDGRISRIQLSDEIMPSPTEGPWSSAQGVRGRSLFRRPSFGKRSQRHGEKSHFRHDKMSHFRRVKVSRVRHVKGLQLGWLPRSSLGFLLLHRGTEQAGLSPGLEPVVLAFDVDGR